MKTSDTDKHESSEGLMDQFTDKLARILFAQCLIERAKRKGKTINVERVINEVFWLQEK